MFSALLLAAATPTAWGFCGTFVGDVGATLTNRSSQIVAVRQGDQTTLTLVNDYSGDLDRFALIIPVPPGLTEGDVAVVDPAHVAQIDAYTAPRLVRYTCEDLGGWEPPDQEASLRLRSPVAAGLSWAAGCSESNLGLATSGGQADNAVTTEAEFTEGEYALTVLSAATGASLRAWMDAEGYSIDDGVARMLQEYIDAGSDFLAVQISLEELDGVVSLRPLRISYRSDVFSLPIRLGTLNSPGEQDLLLYVITDNPGGGEGAGGRVAVANYPEAAPPDECMLRGDAASQLGELYDAQLTDAIAEAGGAAWVSEYGWSIRPAAQHCDPCTVEVPPEGPLSVEALSAFGFDFQGDTAIAWGGPGYFVSRLHLRYAADLVDQDLLLYETGDVTSNQIRYIKHREVLESEFEVCGEGFIEDGGYCRFTPRPTPMTGVVWAACSSQPARRLPALVALLAAAAVLRRRRGA